MLYYKNIVFENVSNLTANSISPIIAHDAVINGEAKYLYLQN
jgi:hypothetical protein